jgi:long-chain acyl-CoA synthetase
MCPNLFLLTSKVLPENYILDYEFDSLLFYNRKELFVDKIFPELAVLLSTSGTTGSPKLVRLAYKSVQSNAQAISDYLQIDSSERPVTTLPLSYSYGLSVINSHLLKGAAIVLTDQSQHSFVISG